MQKDEIIYKIEKRIEDLNYMINTGDKNKLLQTAREYAREELQLVLQWLKNN